MREEGVNYQETARQFAMNDRTRITLWERIYLAEGPKGLYMSGEAGLVQPLFNGPNCIGTANPASFGKHDMPVHGFFREYFSAREICGKNGAALRSAPALAAAYTMNGGQ